MPETVSHTPERYVPDDLGTFSIFERVSGYSAFLSANLQGPPLRALEARPTERLDVVPSPSGNALYLGRNIDDPLATPMVREEGILRVTIGGPALEAVRASAGDQLRAVQDGDRVKLLIERDARAELSTEVN